MSLSEQEEQRRKAREEIIDLGIDPYPSETFQVNTFSNDNEFDNICKKMNLIEHVTFKGQVNNVYDYMKKASVFVLSSLWEEPGFVIQEAAACKKIILTSNCYSGPSEFLNHGKNGYIFKNNGR